MRSRWKRSSPRPDCCASAVARVSASSEAPRARRRRSWCRPSRTAPTPSSRWPRHRWSGPTSAPAATAVTARTVPAGRGGRSRCRSSPMTTPGQRWSPRGPGLRTRLVRAQSRRLRRPAPHRGDTGGEDPCRPGPRRGRRGPDVALPALRPRTGGPGHAVNGRRAALITHPDAGHRTVFPGEVPPPPSAQSTTAEPPRPTRRSGRPPGRACSRPFAVRRRLQATALESPAEGDLRMGPWTATVSSPSVNWHAGRACRSR